MNPKIIIYYWLTETFHLTNYPFREYLEKIGVSVGRLAIPVLVLFTSRTLTVTNYWIRDGTCSFFVSLCHLPARMIKIKIQSVQVPFTWKRAVNNIIYIRFSGWAKCFYCFINSFCKLKLKYCIFPEFVFFAVSRLSLTKQLNPIGFPNCLTKFSFDPMALTFCIYLFLENISQFLNFASIFILLLLTYSCVSNLK